MFLKIGLEAKNNAANSIMIYVMRLLMKLNDM